MFETIFDTTLPYAYGLPAHKAGLKTHNSHFIVEEDLGFEPSGEGEHSYLFIESDGDNSQWVAEHIAKVCSIKTLDIGFCGLKDRNAITRQWFSVYDPHMQATPQYELLQEALPNSTILKITRGTSKLRRGMHRANAFTIRLCFDDIEPLHNTLAQRLASIAETGVPNYFGLQRFGRQGNNLVVFDEWVRNQDASNSRSNRDCSNNSDSSSRHSNGSRTKSSRSQKRRKPKGIILSAARSQLFNRVLAERVLARSWSSELAGDVLVDEYYPTGPLWGRGRCETADEALKVEQNALEAFMPWANALEHLGMAQERRRLMCRPERFEWCFDEGSQLELRFVLPPGEYATSVIREVCQTVEPERHLATSD